MTVFKVEFKDYMFLIESNTIQGATMGAHNFIKRNYESGSDDFFIEAADFATVMEFRCSFPGLILNENGEYKDELV